MQPVTDARGRLAQETRAAHEALHHHPYISRFMSDALQAPEYFTLLGSYRDFYRAAERRRAALDCWQELSLKPTIDRLEADLAAAPRHSIPPAQEVDFSWVGHPVEVLGILYVLHGARFGGRVIARSVNTTLPEAPTQFLRLGCDKEQWSDLVQAINDLDNEATSFAVLSIAANKTFEAFGQWVSAYYQEHVSVSDR